VHESAWIDWMFRDVAIHLSLTRCAPEAPSTTIALLQNNGRQFYLTEKILEFS
jgi:hypothetical protein